MATRATLAFALSIIGAAYQIISLGVAALVDYRTSVYFYFGFTNTILTSLVVFWSASHLLEDWKGRITWPAVIFAIAIANLTNIIILYLLRNPGSSDPNVSLNQILALIPGPILEIIGGIVGFAAVRQYSREHGRVIVHQP